MKPRLQEPDLFSRVSEAVNVAPDISMASSGEIVAGPLAERFAELMVRLNGKKDAALFDAARLVSVWQGEGHICVPLGKLPNPPADLAAKLLATKVVGRPGDWKPLILDEAQRLYLHRYWQYEHRLAKAICERVKGRPPAVDEELLARGLDAFFDPPPDDQRAAAVAAVTSNVCVITGGPGSGKTRTIAGILALLRAQFAATGGVSRILLAAPTGKAAARMTASIRAAVQQLPEVNDWGLPMEAATLHRLLGIGPENPRPHFDATHPLPASAVIVDEASMIDLALMAKLFAAVPPEARIILLGDKDQLSSVEAGHVLGDICEAGSANPAGFLSRKIVELRKSFRFKATSGIYRLSVHINSGRADEALALLRQGTDDVTGLPVPTPEGLARPLRERLGGGLREICAAPDPHLALTALDRFRILCAVRRGPYGVEALNRLVERILAEDGLMSPGVTHYHGRPVMILRNDPSLRLANGDVGLTLRDPAADGELRVFFPDHGGALRSLSPARLPEHETVWAMTVHKSQGSEFDRVLLILPDRDSPVLTRELLYTGITRSRIAVEVWYREAILRETITRRVERVSGLRDALASG